MLGRSPRPRSRRRGAGAGGEQDGSHRRRHPGPAALVGLLVALTLAVGPIAAQVEYGTGSERRGFHARGNVARGAEPRLATDRLRRRRDATDLVERYAGAGAMPTMSALMAAGVRGDNGLLQAFPPNTGVGWYTLAAGAGPAEHGSTNNTFHRVGEADFGTSTSFAAPGVVRPTR